MTSLWRLQSGKRGEERKRKDTLVTTGNRRKDSSVYVDNIHEEISEVALVNYFFIRPSLKS